MEEVIISGFAIYAITFLITLSHIAKPVRAKWRKVIGQGIKYDFISCAMCVGFWVSMATCLWQMSFWDTLSAYGVSYFLRTLERND